MAVGGMEASNTRSRGANAVSASIGLEAQRPPTSGGTGRFALERWVEPLVQLNDKDIRRLKESDGLLGDSEHGGLVPQTRLRPAPDAMTRRIDATGEALDCDAWIAPINRRATPSHRDSRRADERVGDRAAMIFECARPRTAAANGELTNA